MRLFCLFYKEVSLKYHKFNRSIIKFRLVACKKAFFEDLCLEIQAQKLRNV